MSSNRDSTSRFVYSTDTGGKCDTCGSPLGKCRCGQKKQAAPSSDGIVRVQRETKGRKGKGVTLIRGLSLEGEDLKKLAKRLKSKCGSGGTIRDGVIEIQGDHRELIVEELKKAGFTAKRAGG